MIRTYKEIDGWFDYEKIYDNQVNLLKDEDVIVEVGCWLGKSSCYLGKKIKDSGKKIKLFCVDIWDYVDDDPYYHPFKNKYPDLLSIFNTHVNQLGLSEYIFPIQGASVNVAQTFHLESVDFIFIDGNHNAPYINDDLTMWYPILKNGGFIAGHDYQDSVDVQKAVNSFFDDKFIIDGSCWIHQKQKS